MGVHALFPRSVVFVCDARQKDIIVKKNRNSYGWKNSLVRYLTKEIQISIRILEICGRDIEFDEGIF